MKDPCLDCDKKYKCDALRMACPEFKFFVETGRYSVTQNRTPSRAVYVELFYTDPTMTYRGKKH
jgi:hypothetical protein